MVEFDKEGLENIVKELSTKDKKQRLVNFFSREDVKTCLENNDFEGLYKLDPEYKGYYTSDITLVLYLSGIDPLKYLDFVPSNYFIRLPIKTIDIPDGYLFIGHQALSFCEDIESVIIPKSVKLLKTAVFKNDNKLKELHYLGTMEEWEEVIEESVEEWNYDSNIERVVCLDGIVEVK